jgi:SulP family sulfate permease
VPDSDPESYHYVAADGRPECPQIKMMRLNGSIFFGAVSHLQQQIQELEQQAPMHKHLVIMASGINFVDLAGDEFLAQTARRYASAGGSLSFYRMKDSVAETLRKGGFMQDIGEENLYPAKSRPAEALFPRLDQSICATCPHRLFRPCHNVPRPTPTEQPQVAQPQPITEGVLS